MLANGMVALGEAETATEAFAVLGSVGAAIGLPTVHYRRTIQLGPNWIRNIHERIAQAPQSFSTTVSDRFGRSIFVIERLLAEMPRPMLWRDMLKHPDISEDEKGFIEYLLEELGDGLSCAVAGPASRNGIVCFAGRSANLQHGAIIAGLSMFAQQVHFKLCEFQDSENSDLPRLSGRERGILELISIGKTNREIAITLGLSSHTVDTYIKRIFEKLDVSNRVSAAVFASAMGMNQKSIQPPIA